MSPWGLFSCPLRDLHSVHPYEMLARAPTSLRGLVVVQVCTSKYSGTVDCHLDRLRDA
jgi:hypothetical protein